MNIAGIIFESLAKPGGYEIFTYNLHAALAARGHQVTLYLPGRELRRRRELYARLPFAVRPLVPATHFWLKRCPAVLRAHLGLMQRLRGHDVWQVMGAWPEGLASEGVAGLAPRVMRAYGDDVQLAPEYAYGVRRDPARDADVRRIVSGMEACVAMTASLATLLTELGAAPERVRRIPNGIDAARFAAPAGPARRAEVRARLDAPEGLPLVLTVGRHHPKKGFDRIPGLAARLRDAGADFRWVVVGGGTEALLPAIQAAGVAHLVRPHPAVSLGGDFDPTRLQLPVDGLLDLYLAADIFALPSRLEGFSRVILEALAAGLPVATTDAPGCGETFEPGVQGLVSPVDDDPAMAADLLALLGDAPRRRGMGEAARRYAAAFDWTEIAARYEALYEELVRP